MTEQELGGLVFIQARIEKTEERIADLELEIEELEREIGVSSMNMDGMPRGSTPGDPVAMMAISIAALHEKLQHFKAELKEHNAALIEKERQIMAYIASVEDEEVKLIIEWRFIDLLDWYEIASKLEEITGQNVDRSTPGKKMRKYLHEH
jgi:hypothetical protein